MIGIHQKLQTFWPSDLQNGAAVDTDDLAGDVAGRI